MTLQAFLKNKDKEVDVQVIHQMMVGDYESNVEMTGAIEKPHLFDVIKWEVKMNNYKPLVVVYVR